MSPAADAVSAWLFVSCFGLSVVSALLSWFNGEAIALSFALPMRSPADLALLALLAAAGQTLGKCLLYWLGFNAGRLHVDRNGRLQHWRERMQGGCARAMALVFLSSAIGIPPLYLTTLAAGTIGMRFSRFIGAAACGRVLRFGAVVFVPSLLRVWSR